MFLSLSLSFLASFSLSPLSSLSCNFFFFCLNLCPQLQFLFSLYLIFLSLYVVVFFTLSFPSFLYLPIYYIGTQLFTFLFGSPQNLYLSFLHKHPLPVSLSLSLSLQPNMHFHHLNPPTASLCLSLLHTLTERCNFYLLNPLRDFSEITCSFKSQ